jgi:hypothetical protein
MAAENIVSVAPIFSEKIGARIFAVGTVKLPAEYKTEGCEISETQLKELGLTNGLVDVGWVITSGLTYGVKNVEQCILQITVTNPSATPSPKEEAQKVKVQAYESITTALNKELATTSSKVSGAQALVAFIGR